MSAAKKAREDDAGLAGKVAIIAGGGAAGDGIGNGRAAAILLARAGTRVLVVDRDAALAERTVAMIAEEGGTAAAHQADLTDNAQAKRHGRRPRSTASAGSTSSTTTSASAAAASVVEEDPETWRRVMQVNVETMFLAAKHAIPAMIKTAGRGAIVNISSISALRPRGLTAYTASKGAVIALTRAMAVDHAKDGIRVNCVAPGPVYTPMVYARGMSAAAREQRRKASALGIEGTGWDIGQAVRFLLSDHARYITGQTLVVDGGVTLQAPGTRQPIRTDTREAGGSTSDGPRTLSRQVRPRAREPGSAQAHDHAAPGAGAQPQRGCAPSAGSASSSATRAGSTRACASSPSCRSAGSPARPTSGRTTSRSAATSASPTRTSAP